MDNQWGISKIGLTNLFRRLLSVKKDDSMRMHLESLVKKQERKLFQRLLRSQIADNLSKTAPESHVWFPERGNEHWLYVKSFNLDPCLGYTSSNDIAWHVLFQVCIRKAIAFSLCQRHNIDSLAASSMGDNNVLAWIVPIGLFGHSSPETQNFWNCNYWCHLKS